MLSSVPRALPATDLQHMQRPQRSSAVISPCSYLHVSQGRALCPFCTPGEHPSVRERADGDNIIFEVVTGIPDGGQFASHGHTVRLTLRPAGSP